MTTCIPDFTFPPKPDRVGEKSMKVTTQAPKLHTRVNRPVASNGAAPRNAQRRKARA